MKPCEIFELKVIEREFFRNNDYVVMSCMSCKIPMVIPFEHITPEVNSHQELRKKLKEAAKEFYQHR